MPVAEDQTQTLDIYNFNCLQDSSSLEVLQDYKIKVIVDKFCDFSFFPLEESYEDLDKYVYQPGHLTMFLVARESL